MRQAWISIVLLAATATIWSGVGLPTSEAIAQKPAQSTPKKPSVAPINAAQIRKILDAILAAAQKKDVNTVIKYLAPKATIEMTVQSTAGTNRLQLNRTQYQQYLQQGFEASQAYESKLSNVKVQVMAGGKAATATYTIIETVSMNEPPVTVSSATDAIVRFERVNGQILATQMKSTSKVNVKPL